MQHCFNDIQMHRFVLEVAIDNIPSISVAQRLGMRLEGLNIDREWLYDRYVDSNIYAITYPEFND
jgi:ribosomal-protein-serine acetyltransferase